MIALPINTRSYRCYLIDPGVPADMAELMADQGKLRTVRIRAINAGWAERSALHLYRLPVLRVERIEEEFAPCPTLPREQHRIFTTGHANPLQVCADRRFHLIETSEVCA